MKCFRWVCRLVGHDDHLTGVSMSRALKDPPAPTYDTICWRCGLKKTHVNHIFIITP